MTMATQRDIDRAINGIRRGFRAVLTALRLNTPVQLAQADALAGERLSDAELMQHYGFTSAPLPGTQAIVLPIGGQTAHGVIIATEHGQYRFRLGAAGEVALYTDEGDHVHLKRGRVVEIETGTLLVKASSKVRLETPVLEVTGNTRVDGTILDLAQPNLRTMNGMRELYNAHTHHENDVNGNTNVPNETM